MEFSSRPKRQLEILKNHRERGVNDYYWEYKIIGTLLSEAFGEYQWKAIRIDEYLSSKGDSFPML